MNNSYKTLLINLDKDKDRLEYMSKQLNDLNIQFDRLLAVNGKEYLENGGDEYHEDKAIKIGGRILKPGEIGCALSHKRCYQKFLFDKEYENTKYLLILEDDVLLDKNFKTILENEIKKNEESYKWNFLQINYPDNSDIFYICKSFFKKFYIQYEDIKNRIGFLNKIKRMPYLLISPFVSLFLSFRYYFLSKKKGANYFILKMHAFTGAYLIDKKVAKILLDLTQNIIWAADITTAVELYKYKKDGLKFCFYSPLIARQNHKDFNSNIDHVYDII